MTAGDSELWRALAAVADNPADAWTAASAWLEAPDIAEHTEVFVLNCPPYADIHLGAEGGIGGEGADRVAGFWRAIGLHPPAEPGHLSSLLALYADLGEAAGSVRHAAAATALHRARSVLLWEHLWSWVPNWLDAVSDLGTETLGGWAELMRAAREREACSQPGGHLLPAALRDAPPPVEPGCHPEAARRSDRPDSKRLRPDPYQSRPDRPASWRRVPHGRTALRSEGHARAGPPRRSGRAGRRSQPVVGPPGVTPHPRRGQRVVGAPVGPHRGQARERHRGPIHYRRCGRSLASAGDGRMSAEAPDAVRGWRRLLVEPPRPEAVRSSPRAAWLVVGTVCIGAFMGQLDASIVTVAFPTLQRSFGASLAAVQWVGQAYLLVLIGFLPAVGRDADMVDANSSTRTDSCSSSSISSLRARPQPSNAHRLPGPPGLRRGDAASQQRCHNRRRRRRQAARTGHRF